MIKALSALAQGHVGAIKLSNETSNAGGITNVPSARNPQALISWPSRRKATSQRILASDPVTERLGPQSTPISIAPVTGAGMCDALATVREFLRVVEDLLTFAVGRWDAGRFPRAQTVEQQAYHLGFHAPTLFPRHQLKRSKYRHEWHQPMQVRHLADPAARRAAFWLVPQVIWYVPSGPPRLSLRLGVTPQDEFFGSRRHAGWAWLTERALAWPARYRARHWRGFDDVTDTLKVQLTPLKG